LRAAYAPKFAALEERLRKADQAVERERSQSRTSMWGTVLSAGSTIAGALLGRKKISATTIGKATTAARSMGRTAKEESDVGRAKDSVRALEDQLADLEDRFREELDALKDRVDPARFELTTKSVKPKKTNISVRTLALAWVPYWQTPKGAAEPAFV
jgi:hypothetical protein